MLEKIVLEPSAFSDNANLKKLLLLTAIRSDKGKVMAYIEKVEGFDVEEIANIAIEHGLYEEAFTLYRKHAHHLNAMNVLVEYIVSIDRASQYANKVNETAVWSRLGKAQLDGLRIKDAIDSYIKAADPANYLEVIETASRAAKFDDLVRYLQMARKTLREPVIDTELAFSYARTDRLHDMEEFLGMTNVADQLSAGEKAFDVGLYEAAKLLFSSISNWARLATTLIYLGENQAAVEAARKAGNTQFVFLSSESLFDADVLSSQSLEASQRRLSRQEGVPTRSDLRTQPHRSRRRTFCSYSLFSNPAS